MLWSTARGGLALALAVVALLTAGCRKVEIEQYDNDVFSCSVSDGKIEATVYVYRDSDQTNADRVPLFAVRACDLIRHGRTWNQMSRSGSADSHPQARDAL